MKNKEYAVIISISKREDNMHNPYKALWTVALNDAKKICNDDRTQGLGHFLAYFKFINIANYQHFKFISDNGRYNKLLKDHGIHIYQSKNLGHDNPMPIKNQKVAI